jgi:dienelactone hydrolase
VGNAMSDEIPFYKRRILYEIAGVDRVQVRRDLVYASHGGGDLTLDSYQPANLSPDARLPGVIIVHGGPIPPAMRPPEWPAIKDWDSFISYGQLVAASGLVGITFNHRYEDHRHINRSFEDVTAAIAYVRGRAAAFNLDPDRLCVWVFSGAGPHLALFFHNRPHYLRCVVAYYPGMADISTPEKLDRLAGEALSDEERRNLSVTSYLKEEAAAGLSVFIARAGLDDPETNEWIDLSVQEALAANAALDLMNHPTGRHAFDILDNDTRTREIIARTIEFIKANV